MDPILLLIGLVFLLVVVGIFLILGQNSKDSNKTETGVIRADFVPTQMYRGGDGLGGLAVNERTRQICLFKTASSRPELFPTADLIGVSLIKNGEIVSEGIRSFPSQVVTFSLQLQQHKESLIESLHTNSQETGTQRIDLLVMVYDPDEPTLLINFLSMDTLEGDILFGKSLSTATHWHNVLNGLILEADKLAGAPPKASPPKEANEMVNVSP